MTFEVIFLSMKNVHLHNFSIPVNLHQNRFINKCARENLALFPTITQSVFCEMYVEELTFLIMRFVFSLVERHYTCIIVNIA